MNAKVNGKNELGTGGEVHWTKKYQKLISTRHRAEAGNIDEASALGFCLEKNMVY